MVPLGRYRPPDVLLRPDAADDLDNPVDRPWPSGQGRCWVGEGTRGTVTCMGPGAGPFPVIGVEVVVGVPAAVRVLALALSLALLGGACVEDPVDPADLRGDPAPSPTGTVTAGTEVTVAEHRVTERTFDVTAAAEDGDVCVTVTADDERTTDCGRAQAPLELRVVTVGDLDALVGLVDDPEIRSIRFITNEGEPLPDELNDAVLTDVPGTDGVRALSPSFAPALLPRAEGLDSDGEVVAEASIDAPED